VCGFTLHVSLFPHVCDFFFTFQNFQIHACVKEIFFIIIINFTLFFFFWYDLCK
jgi:hypothetical protein